MYKVIRSHLHPYISRKQALTIGLAVGLPLLLSACGNSPQKQAKADNAPSYDTENPTTYAEYKKWRAKNDLAAERYAEYKEWEINFRRWKAQQER